MWRWRKMDTIIEFPACLQERLRNGELMAPTLREERRANGERFAVLDFIVEVEKEDTPGLGARGTSSWRRLGCAFAPNSDSSGRNRLASRQAVLFGHWWFRRQAGPHSPTN